MLIFAVDGQLGIRADERARKDMNTLLADIASRPTAARWTRAWDDWLAAVAEIEGGSVPLAAGGGNRR